MIVIFGETDIKFLLFESCYKNTCTIAVSSYTDKFYFVKSTLKKKMKSVVHLKLLLVHPEHNPYKRKHLFLNHWVLSSLPFVYTFIHLTIGRTFSWFNFMLHTFHTLFLFSACIIHMLDVVGHILITGFLSPYSWVPKLGK